MAWNEPQWGKRGNDGPPDLDELFKRAKERIGRLFGGKKGGGDAGPGPSGDGGSVFPSGGVGIVLILLVLVWIASGFYIVDAGERGIVLRFGSYLETTQPGPRWHLPWPIEAHEIVNLEQVRTVEVGYRNNVKAKVLNESLMLTDDENIIDIQFALQYILKDPEDFLFANRTPEEAVMQAAETAIREIVGKSKMDFVLYEGRAEVAARAQKLMQEILDRYKTGVAISKVTMQNAQPPEQVQASFDDAVKAGQDRERLKNEGQAYANDVIPKARGLAARLTQEAEGYRQAVIANAEGDAQRFRQVVAEYAKAPQVTRDRMYFDTMQEVLSRSSKVVVDAKGGNNLLYLPLDKMMEMSSSAATPRQEMLAPQAQHPETPTTESSNWRSREAFRSREREDRP